MDQACEWVGWQQLLQPHPSPPLELGSPMQAQEPRRPIAASYRLPNTTATHLVHVIKKTRVDDMIGLLIWIQLSIPNILFDLTR